MNFLSNIYHALSPSGWAGLVFLLLFGWFWIFGNKGFYELEMLKQQRARLLLEEKEGEKKKRQLEAELERLKDPRYQRHLIHRDLGFIEEDEVMILFRRDP